MNGRIFSIDYQVHSFLSHDGKASIMDHCRRALELGLDEIGFSEHKDFDPGDPVVNWFNYDRYVDEIEAARKAFSNRLTIRMGVEVDYQNWFEQSMRDYLKAHPFDYVIGSVHYAAGAMLMTPEYLAGRSANAAYRLYFEEIQASVESGLIDILGHLEYANKRGVIALGPYNPEPYRSELVRLFKAMIRKNVALEINTAGLRQNAGGTYPSADTVKMYVESGGRLLTFGSDAHHPDDLAYAYGEAVGIAETAGLSEVLTYSMRTPTAVNLRK